MMLFEMVANGGRECLPQYLVKVVVVGRGKNLRWNSQQVAIHPVGIPRAHLGVKIGGILFGAPMENFPQCRV
jgi:hypothetical protein